MSRSLDVYKKCDLRESDECESTLSLVVNVKIIAMRNNMLLDVDGTHRCLALGLLDSLLGSATITFGCLIVYEILFQEMRILLSHAVSETVLTPAVTNIPLPPKARLCTVISLFSLPFPVVESGHEDKSS